MHKLYEDQYFMLFQCHLLQVMFVFCYNSKFISIQFIINARAKRLSYFLFIFLQYINYFNTRKQISLQFYQLAKYTYFTRAFGCGQFLAQLTKIPANNIMLSSYDFMQCERGPDTISVSIHNVHFSFKCENEIVEKKIIIICKFKTFLKF